MKNTKIDKPFLVSVIILIITGFFIFSSASLGLLASNSGKYQNVAFSQTFFGLFLGSIALIFFSRVNYKIWKKYALYIFIGSLILTALVFVPGIGFAHGGAKRWLDIFGFSFQPSELLKIGFIIYFSAWVANSKDKIQEFKHGFLPLIVLLTIIGSIIIKQPDTATFAVIAISGIGIFIMGGGKWRYVGILFIIGALTVGLLAFTRPYVMQRIDTFFNPKDNSQSSSYQLQQSLIAIGSGGFSGRGFGQSVQKFNFLPEPIGDSIFAVASEEFGFLGSSFLIFLYLYFTFRGFKIAGKVEDSFGRLLIVGIVILIASQAFVNISAMLGVLPLSGITLPFVSHGGSALALTLAEAGIILNISKTRKNLKSI